MHKDKNRRNVRIMSQAITIFLYVASIALVSSSSLEKPERLPNILLILTDDQDVALHGMFPLEQTRKLLGASGAVLSNAFTTTPLCCPSRASLLTGRYAHNHHTTNNSISGGCYGQTWRTVMETNALPVLLQQRGYRTFFAGKYLNTYKGDRLPPGWHDFHGLHGNSRYYNYTLRENAKNVTYTSEYLTDLLKNRTLSFLANATMPLPFFAMVSPPAAHAPFTPAERHRGTFKDITALRTPNFNYVTTNSLEKHWLVGTSQLIPNETLTLMDTYFQERWETLLAVDEMVAALVQQLVAQNQLAQTYIVYTSDNGYHVGQFAQPFDKRQPYETDIRVPMLIRGPGIEAGTRLTAPVSLIDLTATILEWAQLSIPAHIDGQSFDQHLRNSAQGADPLLYENFKRSLLIEYWGEGNEETYNPDCPGTRQDYLAQCNPLAACHCQDAWNNTYSCVRDFRYQIDRIYCRFKDNESFIEAYDLNEDPYQMTNIAYEILPIEAALYDIALDKLARCKGSACNDVHI